MTTLQAEPALALWRSLAPLARLVVEVVAVSEGPVPQASLLSEAGMLAQRLGRAAGGASSLVQDLRPAERGGLLIFKKELDLTEPGREAIIRALLHEGRYEAVAAAAASLRPAPPSFDWYGWRRLPPGVARRELRRAVYRGSNADWQEFRTHAPQTSLASLITEPLEIEVIRHMEPALQLEALLMACYRRNQLLLPEAGLQALLAEAAETRGTPQLWGLLAGEALLSGDLPTARAALPHLARSRDTLDAVGLIHLALGDIRGADKAYAAWLAEKRSAYSGQTYVPHSLAGQFLPLAYLLRGTPARSSQALRLLSVASTSSASVNHGRVGAWQALGPLLDPDRVDTHQPHPDPHPVAVLIEALAAAWRQLPLPEAARLDQAQARARRAGYQWLDDELQSVRTGSVARRGELVPLLSHREPEPRWARVLEAIRAQVPARARSRTPPADDRSEHIAWLLTAEPFDLEARVRKPRRDGWSEGKSLAGKRIAEGLADVRCATDADRRVAAFLGNASYANWSPSAYPYGWNARVWTALVGHPNLFDLKSRTPVTVARRAPRLVIQDSPEGQQLRVVPTAAQAIVVQPVGTHGFEVYELDDKQLSLARLLGTGLLVPPAGRQRIEDLIQGVGAIIEVSGEEEAGAPVQAGDARAVARLARLGEGLSCHLVVRPAGSEGPTLEPGSGSALILARTPAGPVRVQRDLAAERAAFEAARGALPALDAAEWTGEGWKLPGLVDALELLSQLHTLREQVALEWFEGDPLRLKGSTTGTLRLTVAAAEGWFEARGTVAIDEDQVLQLSQLLRLLPQRQGRFVPLGEAGFLALSADLLRHLEELERAGRLHGDELRLHPLAAPLLAPLVDGAETADLAPAWQEQLQRMAAPPPDAPLPVGLDAELRPYQLDGFRWLSRLAAWGVGACLADDMGLGKTVQTLALLLDRAGEGPALVVAPTSVCHGWREQCWRFTPDLVAYDLRQGDRQRTLDGLMAGDIVVCSYGLLVSEQERLAAIDWATVVFDESQTIKNPQTQRHQAARSLRAGFRVALTGTPVENRLEELWAQMAVLNPGLLGSAAHFRSRFTRPIAEGDREAMRQLRRLVRPVVLRRTKAEVLDDLPDKTIIDVPVELHDEELAIYEALRRQAHEATLDLDGEGRFQMLAWLTRLRLAACHARLAVDTAPVEVSAKQRALDDIVERLQEGGHRALIFSQFTGHLDLVQARLDAQGVGYQRLDGTTPPVERQRRVAAFQRGEGLVFLISLRAGGFGLNLTAADYVVHLDPWWNPAVEAQASDRAHRIGQTRPVTVYRLFAQGTVEERILELQHDKRAVAEALMEGADAAASLGVNELREILLG